MNKFCVKYLFAATGTFVIEDYTKTMESDIVYDVPKGGWSALLIGMGPFFIHSVVALLLGIFCYVPTHILKTSEIIYNLLSWLALCIGIHAIPNRKSVDMTWKMVMGPNKPLLPKIVAMPLLVVMFAMTFSFKSIIDFFYAAILLNGGSKIVLDALVQLFW